MGANELTLRPSYWASVSGGKDSLFMLKLILENPDIYPLNGVVHIELEIDFPFIKTVIDYMKKQCSDAGIRFVSVKPRRSFYDLVNERGFPTNRARWCNKYKVDALKQLDDFLHEQGEYLVSYVGFCADEVKRFRTDLFSRPEDDRKVRHIYPIAEQGITEDKILEWAKTVDLFNDYYKYNKRCGCMFCPLQDMKTTAYLLKFYPGEYDKFRSMVEKTEKELAKRYNKESFSVFQSNPKYNFAYRDKLVREKYLKQLEVDIE